jgi:TolA-binding protein
MPLPNPNVLQPRAEARPAVVAAKPQINSSIQKEAAEVVDSGDKDSARNALVEITISHNPKGGRLELRFEDTDIETLQESPNISNQVLGIDIQIAQLDRDLNELNKKGLSRMDPEYRKREFNLKKLKGQRQALEIKNGSEMPNQVNNLAQEMAKIRKEKLPPDVDTLTYIERAFNDGIKNPELFISQLQAIPGLSTEEKTFISDAIKEKTGIIKTEGTKAKLEKGKQILLGGTLLSALVAYIMFSKTLGEEKSGA